MGELSIEEIKALERTRNSGVSFSGTYEVGDAVDALRGLPDGAVQRIFNRLAGRDLIARSGSVVSLTEAGEAAYLAGWTPG